MEENAYLKDLLIKIVDFRRKLVELFRKINIGSLMASLKMASFMDLRERFSKTTSDSHLTILDHTIKVSNKANFAFTIKIHHLILNIITEMARDSAFCFYII